MKRLDHKPLQTVFPFSIPRARRLVSHRVDRAAGSLATWRLQVIHSAAPFSSVGTPSRAYNRRDVAGVFLSYRRNDSGGWAGRLRDHLVLRYGEDRVWQDVDDLTIGSDYLLQILKNIAKADAVLIVIGPHWLDERSQGGTTRLADAKDVLRTEIVHALKKSQVSSPRWLVARERSLRRSRYSASKPKSRVDASLVREKSVSALRC
jgi:hypothetical protein